MSRAAKWRSWRWLDAGAMAAVLIGMSLILGANAPGGASDCLVNVSYDPTRELYQAIDPLFVAEYEKVTRRHLTIVQSHGGSSRQARKVIEGEQPADVVTLGLFSDIEALRKRGLIAANWADRLPNHSLPYTSTIVFVVRQGNPRGIKDWPDLVSPGVEVVTPDPRTSGNGKFAALAAWAAVNIRGGSEAEAAAYLRTLYQHAPTLDEGARASAIRFATQEIGDVHLTWENEALREVAEATGRLQVVYPPVSILAEPNIAWVDSAVANTGKLEPAKAYLGFLFSETGQETIARFGYRPLNAESARKAGVSFPDLKLVPVTAIARDWNDAAERFFAENGVIDMIVGWRPK